MKKLLAFSLLLIPLAGCLSGCAGLASTIEQLKNDPAIVTGQITTIYGNLKFTRVGAQCQTNATVTVGTDGAVTIKTP